MAFLSNLSRAVLVAIAIVVLVAPIVSTAPMETPAALQGGLRGGEPPSVIQGYRLSEIRVVGARALPNEFIQSSLGLIPGEVYDESKLERSVPRLNELRFFEEIKIEDFQITPSSEKKAVVDVVLRVKEKRR